MTKIVGGKLDGEEGMLLHNVTMREGDEVYVLISFKEGNDWHSFYMVADDAMTPAQAIKTYRERTLFDVVV